jgi:hypothetical protein
MGRRLDPDSRAMPPAPGAEVDTAVYRYFEQVGLDVEATREQLTAIRAAVVGEVFDAAGIAAVRSALLRLFDGFRLHHGIPGKRTLS